jgi:hypothetical protein
MKRAIGFAVTFLAFVATVCAQPTKPLNSKLPDVVHRMDNGNLRSRESAFDELMTIISAADPTRADFTVTADPLNGFFVSAS